LDAARRQAPRLPVDHPDGVNREASVRIVVERLGEEETRALLRDVPKAWRTQVSDALLTALTQAFSAWTGAPRLLVDLEGHGRESLFDDVDLSRTMGWFTALYPVLLDLSGARDDTAALQRVKEQLRAVPGGGIGYGLLRHCAADPAVTAALLDLPQAQVSFNYGGRSVGSGEKGWIAPAAEDRGPLRSPRALRSHLLEIEGQVADGQLEMYWHYSEALHRRSTIEALARGFSSALRRLIVAAASPESARVAPADFPGARLGQDDLDRFFARLGRTAKETRV
jgi:non-ribosomal peptide synthase protein (TIGR01720 family)